MDVYDSVDIFCFGVQLLSLLLLLLSLLLLILLPAPAPDIVGAHSVSTTDVVSTHISVPHTACQRPSPFYAQFEDLALGLVVFCDMVWILTDFNFSAVILVDVH